MQLQEIKNILKDILKDKKSGSEMINNLPKITRLIVARGKFWTRLYEPKGKI